VLRGTPPAGAGLEAEGQPVQPPAEGEGQPPTSPVRDVPLAELSAPEELPPTSPEPAPATVEPAHEPERAASPQLPPAPAAGAGSTVEVELPDLGIPPAGEATSEPEAATATTPEPEAATEASPPERDAPAEVSVAEPAPPEQDEPAEAPVVEPTPPEQDEAAASPSSTAVLGEMPDEETGGTATKDAIFQKIEPSVWLILSAESGNVRQGSAVAVGENRLLASCKIMHSQLGVAVIAHDDVIDDVDLVSRDVASDRCVLAPKQAKLQPVPAVRPFASLEVGETVYVVGAPSGLSRTSVEGTISGLAQDGGIGVIETTIPQGPGSPGAAVVDASGRLVGITTANGQRGRGTAAVAAESFWE
jgi:S1-C subfamily serine protease